ncbi:MAG: shikimate dehydrogenase [Methylococcaceae bacterium]|nr:shikimate dehydrogenase [Methylococcaceae bacterium]
MPEYDCYAVFGHPVNHSKSPRIHRLFAGQTGQIRVKYEACDVPAEKFETRVHEFIAQGGKGLNCTIPLKELAFQIAAETSQRAAFCKAVNTLTVREDASLFGDNTDGIGLVRDLQNNLKIVLMDLDILVLGAGGASRGILGPILECKPGKLFIANRTAEKARYLACEFHQFPSLSAGGLDELEGRKFDLILNATAASLTGDLPRLPDQLLNPNGACYDLAYALRPTAFVQWGRTHKASISVDGIGMLVEQAAEAFRIWRGVIPDTAPVIRILRNETAV